MNYDILDTTTTIVAPATAEGGAVMVVRLSGNQAIEIADKLFRGRRRLATAKGYTLHYGHIVDNAENIIDDAVVALFRAPHSYTGEDSVEISLHGSRHIVNTVLKLSIEHGARMATAGEFTRRAFLNGKMDLSRAEAVADVIASDSQWSHNIASTQMRGDYSTRLNALRDELLRLCSLLELELDFSEEDVEFADRSELKSIIDKVEQEINYLCSSFTLGNAIKNGVNVAIIGEPNVGKSTLLNRLIGDDCAMVSDIAGTTRDTIEATTVIDGIRFRFVDTAGLRATNDRLEQMGIERTYRAISKAHIVLHLATADNPDFNNYPTEANPQAYIRVINKIDKNEPTGCSDEVLYISAKADMGIDKLRERMRSAVDTSSINSSSVVVSNMRHYEALTLAHEALGDAQRALGINLSGDLISEDIRRIIHHLGEITGDITSDDILQSIFSKFCIGK